MKALLPYAVMAVLAGGLLPIQALVNSRLGAHMGGAFSAAVCNFVVGATFAVTVALLLRPNPFHFSAAPNTSWWMWLGGVLGVTFVAVGAFAIPKLGAAFFIALFVGGQMLMSMALDHYGVAGLTENPATWPRLLGMAMIIGGVAVIQKF